MRTIHKYPLRYHDTATTVGTYKGFKPVHVGFDPGNTPCVWGEVDTSQPSTTGSFHVVGTGQEIPSGSFHCGSFRDQQFIWHIYWKEQA